MTLATAAQSAAPVIISAFGSSLKPSGLPAAMRPTPPKEMAVPIQPHRPKRSPRVAVAISAVKTGMVLMMKLAGPAATVVSPILSKTA